MVAEGTAEEQKFNFRWGIAWLDESRNGGTEVPGFVLRNYHKLGVSPAAMLLIIHLSAYHYNCSNGAAKPSLKTISELMGYKDDESVRQMVRDLKDKNLIIITPNRGQCSTYDFSPFAEQCLKLDSEKVSNPGRVSNRTRRVPSNHNRRVPSNPDWTEEIEDKKENTKQKEIPEPEKTPVQVAPQSDQSKSDAVEETPAVKPAPKARKPRPRDLWIDTIAECVFKIKPGTPLGKRTGARCGTIKSEVLTTYPDLTPEKFRQICAWKSPYLSEDGPKLVKMIGEYGDQHKPGGSNGSHDDFRPAPRDDSKYAIRKREPGSIPPEVLAARATRQNPLVPRGLPRTELAGGDGGLPDVRGAESGDEKRAA
jgi:hypothetical protein